MGVIGFIFLTLFITVYATIGVACLVSGVRGIWLDMRKKREQQKR